jgi:hypothetical protein
MAEDDYAHFKEFYNKLNVLCELHNTPIKAKLSKVDDEKKIEDMGKKKHIPDELNKTFIFDIQGSRYTTELTIYNANNSINIMISQDIKYNGATVNESFSEKNTWFEKERFKLFTIDTSDPDTNVVALNSLKNVGKNLGYINTLFQFESESSAKYVWARNIDMLALFNRPVLLLAFDMYCYNNSLKHLFTNTFKIETTDLTKEDDKMSVHKLLNMEKFQLNRRPTFLMLLMYYAGYSFNIKPDDITKKFRNKFYNEKSFEIKLYAPIDNQGEIEYNNLLKSSIKSTSVNLIIETLEVYHVGKISSLWDYVNGKLTILINNMLTRGTDKERYKALLMKEYTSNTLFLMECIKELKKYKEYIINPLNITAIAYPISTLKTIEILILKLSYILSVLEPTFIPLETMSFDLIMDGKKFKYVINSELQATNISVEDHTSNDTLMMAILSTRDILVADDDATKTTAKSKSLALIPTDDANNIYIRKFEKEANIYENIQESNTIEKEKLNKTLHLLNASLEKRGSEMKKSRINEAGDVTFNTDKLKLLETERDIAVLTYRATKAEEKVHLAQDIIKAINGGSIKAADIVTYNSITVPNDNEEKEVAAVKEKQEELNTQSALLESLRAGSIRGGSSKNTTKKVNRKQRQTHSKKKVFES